ncbi:29089_t:CDS:2, partial [Racocetra persica]
MDYLIGTCYQCAKCLYCKEDFLKSSCECDKNIAPTTRNPDSKTKYNYNTEFTENFKFSFCFACNSKWYRIGKAKPTKSKLTKSTKSKSTRSTNSKSTKSISPTEHASFDTNNHITNISETNKLDDHTTFDTNNYITNISETHKLDVHTTFNTNKHITNIPEINDHTAFDTPIYDEFKDLLDEDVKVSDLENDNFSRLLDELDNKDNKYETDSCGKFHYQILSHIQYQLNDTTITQNDYVLSYKVTKETRSRTQIINESDFKSFFENYNQATNRKKE